jgi:hypothetical protein
MNSWILSLKKSEYSVANDLQEPATVWIQAIHIIRNLTVSMAEEEQ